MRQTYRGMNVLILFYLLFCTQLAMSAPTYASELDFDTLDREIAVRAIELQKLYPCDSSIFRNWGEEVEVRRQSMLSAYAEIQIRKQTLIEVYRQTGEIGKISLERYENAYSRYVRSRYCMQQAQRRIR